MYVFNKPAILSKRTTRIYTCIWDKVHIFWEGHKILPNLHLTFVLCSVNQKLGGDFAKFCGLLRIPRYMNFTKHPSSISVERFISENFDKKAVTSLILFVGMHWFFEKIPWAPLRSPRLPRSNDFETQNNKNSKATKKVLKTGIFKSLTRKPSYSSFLS